MNALAKLPKLEGNVPGSNFADQVFGGEMTDTFERIDDTSDRSVKKSSFKKLALNIDGSINHMFESLELV